MAEGILRQVFGNDYEVFSAGTMPSIVRPEAIKAMAEIDIDISKHRSKSVDEFASREIDYVLTVCDNAKENCPFFPALTRLIHHACADPAEVVGDEEIRLAAFRNVRDNINAYARNEFSDNIRDH